MVQEYDAWLGDSPGPGAGGSNNNLGGRSGGNIFWDIVIGGSAYTLDTRILITPNAAGWYEIPGSTGGAYCSPDFNADPATTTVTYVNVDKGIAVELPYNSRWGSSQYRINPYDTTPGTVRGEVIFGWIAPFEGCTVIRQYQLKFLPAKSAIQLADELRQNSSYHDVVATTLNNLSVVEYSAYGLCDGYTVVVIGEKANYQFYGDCTWNFTDLENIARTVRLI